jgi:hypothetical protein
LEEVVKNPEYIPTPLKNLTVKRVASIEGQNGIEMLRNQVVRIETNLVNLGSRVESDAIQDSLMFARIRDELDAISNTKKEDKIIVTGLTNNTPMPQATEARRKWLMDMIGGIFDTIVPNSSKDILYIDLGKKYKRDSASGSQNEKQRSCSDHKTPIRIEKKGRR